MLRLGAVVVPALLIGLAGCGGDDGDSGSGSGSDGGGEAAVAHPCDVLTPDEVAALLGQQAEQTRLEPTGESTGSCLYQVGDGDVGIGLFGQAGASFAEVLDARRDEGYEVSEYDADGFDESFRVVDSDFPDKIDLYLATQDSSFVLTVQNGEEAASLDLAEQLLPQLR
ncbi:hypothetical protein [Nocardioides plantarum]|uniref:DUF3558 domain-containing protein n=1 Tax=Nocardioides plantarum TaxID=29299 RepID=A0ABV5K7A9_9ACTN|nr:hypothetical protein [Nocardioides plantarum]